MARRVAVLEHGATISERLAIASICRCFGGAAIEAAVAGAGRASRRQRELPAHVVVYYVIAMALLMHVNLREVLRCLLAGLRSVTGAAGPKVTGKSGISQARTRLGSEPLRRLCETEVKPIATAASKGAWYRGLRLVSLDGGVLDLPDEPGNRQAFGSPRTHSGDCSFPQIRFIGLAEIGTHVLFGMAMAPYRTSEVELAHAAVQHLAAGMLCLADRGFFGVRLFEQAKAAGAELLWRAPGSAVLPVGEALADGSYLSELSNWQRRRSKGSPSVAVRVIDYRLDGVSNHEQTFRLVTTLLDPAQAPAEELAALYQQRWAIELAFDELKTHLRGQRIALRSKTPELVRQEFYGLLLAHFAVRGLMHEAACQVDQEPARWSFSHSLSVIRRKLVKTAPLSP